MSNTFSTFQLDVQEAISYSRLVSKTFTDVECIRLHQHANLGIKITAQLQQKLNNVIYLIDVEKWEKPDLKITESRMLMQMDIASGKYIKVN